MFFAFCLVCTVAQQGTLCITTEFGKMKVEPLEICVIQVVCCQTYYNIVSL